jgi:Protein of unknown function (DUF551)
MSEWQNISTAPLPAFDPDKYWEAAFRCLVCSAPWDAKCARYSYTSRGKGRWQDDAGYVTNPTHWMPLPKSPENSA